MVEHSNESKASIGSIGSKKTRLLLVYLVIAASLCSLSLYFAYANPQGATITSNSTDTGPSWSPQSNSELGGRIITLTLNLEQQDYAWKAYVGNVTGNYVLKNSNNFSIYEWPLGAAITGEVYMSRNSSVTWSPGNVTCASNAQMVTEQGIFGMGNTATDNINNTFNATNHTGFSAGSGNTLGANTCRSIALWVNDTRQTPSSSAVFQEVALHDEHTVVFASIINNDVIGFDNSTIYDFQAIVPENRTAQTGTTYYFYVELGS
ncbi:MAG TPA: hypothetical protein VJ461_05225 [Candidatus Nanoarchaeia archaeon]|nr:hypothetical protein [Candidatus Nanoarchaeia archaeon]